MLRINHNLMGTSNLYGGPKRTILLPPDYLDIDGEGPFVEPDVDDVVPPDNPLGERCPEEDENLIPSPITLQDWGSVKRNTSKAASGSGVSIKGLTKSYVRALGGYKQAAGKALAARNTAARLFLMFSGSPEVIQKRLEEQGVQFEGRSSIDIVTDICELIAPVPDTAENALVSKALSQAFSDFFSRPGFDAESLNLFDMSFLLAMLERMTVNYIFFKLIRQSGIGCVRGNIPVHNTLHFEKDLKVFIDGIVKVELPKHIQTGLTGTELNRAIKELYVDSYKVMMSMR